MDLKLFGYTLAIGGAMMIAVAIVAEEFVFVLGGGGLVVAGAACVQRSMR